MLSYLSDLLFLAVVLGTAYWASQKGMIDSGVLFISMLIASLLAITTFEPVTGWLYKTYLLPTDIRIARYFYFTSALGIFSFALGSLIWCAALILPEAPVVPLRIETIGRRVIGAMTGYLFASFLLTTILTLPAPRAFWGALEPEADLRPSPIMGCAPDYQFLALADYTCEHAFALLGGSWGLGRPVFSAEPDGGRWATFPIRYSKFRESRNQL